MIGKILTIGPRGSIHRRGKCRARDGIEDRDGESRVKRKLGAAADRNADTNCKIDEASRDYSKGTHGSRRSFAHERDANVITRSDRKQPAENPEYEKDGE